MSSTDLNSKFKNHRAREQALWSMLSLQQCMFALTGHLFTSGPVCLEHFSSGSSHCWLLLTYEASTSVSPGHPFESVPPLSQPFLSHRAMFVASELVSLSHIFYLVIYLFLGLAPPLECELCEERYLVCREVQLCVLSTLNCREVVNKLLLHEPIYHCVSERNWWQTWRLICEFTCK